MESFRIHTTLTLDDWRAVQKAAALRVQQANTVKPWRVAALWCAIAIATFATADALDVELNLLSLFLGAVLVVAVMITAHKRNVRIVQPREGSRYLSPCEYELNARGVTCVKQGANSFSEWQQLIDVTSTAEHLFVWLETFTAYVIPVRDLPEGISAEQVVATCKEWMVAPLAQAPAVATLVSDIPLEAQATPPPAIDKPESSWRTLFRLLTLRRIDPPATVLSGKVLPIVLLGLVSLALWVGLSWFYYQPEPTFFPYSAPALSWYVLALVAVAVTLAKRSHPEAPLSKVFTLLALSLPVLIVADFAITQWVPEQASDFVRWSIALYAILFCARGLYGLTGNRQPTAVASGILVAAIFLWTAGELYVYPAVWTSQDPEEYAEDFETDRDAGEALLFEQPARIDASVSRIERATGDEPAGFFVGFAGFGDQRVFAEEIKFAAQKFSDRYHTADRTLLLINDRRDRDAQPLATVSGLRYALKALASKMRLDQDVLFLALSSHGSDDPLLSVENGMLPLRDLTGDVLAEALRASGIKWRVIVISACHAGAFIEPLRDPYTIVITAASPDRTSFGCSDDRDLTYFGEAFFRDSFPQAASLREAFDAATKLVTEREAKEGFDASNPQAFFGEQIEPHIALMLRTASVP